MGIFRLASTNAALMFFLQTETYCEAWIFVKSRLGVRSAHCPHWLDAIFRVRRLTWLVGLCKFSAPAAQTPEAAPDNRAERESRKSWIAHPECAKCAVPRAWEEFLPV